MSGATIRVLLLAAHEHLHILDRPRTVQLELAGLLVAVAGFPCERNRIRARLPDLIDLEINTTGFDSTMLSSRLRERLADLDPNAVVRIAFTGKLSAEAGEAVRAAGLRALAPPSMTVSTRWRRGSGS